MKKIYKDILKILAYSAFIIGVWLSSHYSYEKDLEILNEGKSAVGQLSQIKKKGLGFFDYFVDGIEYSSPQILIKPNTFVVGEKYQVNYLLEDPKGGVVNLKKPIFDKVLYLKGETVNYSVMRKVKEEDYVLIEFAYTIDRIKYNRVQFSDYKHHMKYSKNNAIRFFYSKTNPQISYLDNE